MRLSKLQKDALLHIQRGSGNGGYLLARLGGWNIRHSFELRTLDFLIRRELVAVERVERNGVAESLYIHLTGVERQIVAELEMRNVE